MGRVDGAALLSGRGRALLAALGAALPVLLWSTRAHVVPTADGVWRGLTDPPGPVTLLGALVTGVLAARFARRWALPLVAVGIAAVLPCVPLATGWLTPLLALQGVALVVVAAVIAGAVLGARSSSEAAPKARPWVLFAAAFAAYGLYGLRVPGPAGPQGDEPHYLVMAESLRADGDLDLRNQFQNRDYRAFFPGTLEAHTSPASPRGVWYPVHAPGLAALILPAFALFGYPGARLFVSALAALAGVLVHRLVRETSGSEWTAWAAWAVVSFTPPLPFYAVALYPETPAALATAWLLLAARRDTTARRVSISALAAAALPWLHPKLLPLAALGLGLVLARRGPRAARAAGAALFAASLAGLLFYFHALYGRASLQAAYGAGFASDVAVARIPWGLLGLLLDRQFGLLAVAPAWLLAAPGFLVLWSRRPGDALCALLLGAASALVGAAFSMWWGGTCAPARFLIPALPALAVAAAPALRDRRRTAAALGSLGLALVLLSAVWPAVLQNRADGRSALLAALSPAVDLGSSLPSFVVGGGGATLVAWTLLAALALAWRFGGRGALAGAFAFALVSGAARGAPWLDPRGAALELIEAWDGANVVGASGPLRVSALRIPLDLPDAPWTLKPGDARASRRLELPGGLYRFAFTSRVVAAQPHDRVARLELAAGDLTLAQAYVQEGKPAPELTLPAPMGLRRLALAATGLQGEALVAGASVEPLQLVPRGLRARFPWPQAAVSSRYRVPANGAFVTVLDRSVPTSLGTAFALQGEQGAFLVEAPVGSEVSVSFERQPRPDDVFLWGARRFGLSAATSGVVSLRAEGVLALGGMALVPVRLRAYGAVIGFSGSLGATSASESSAASPSALPMVTTTSPPPDSGK